MSSWGVLNRELLRTDSAARDEYIRRVDVHSCLALLNKAVGAQWNSAGQVPQLGAPLEPGWLQLESGLAQIVTQDRVTFRRGRLTADVPAPARGFRVDTPHSTGTDLGTSFALDVTDRQTELHVFKGAVKLQPGRNAREHDFKEGAGAIVGSSNALRPITANPAAFATLFDLQEKSLATQALRYNRWQIASEQLTLLECRSPQPSRHQRRFLRAARYGLQVAQVAAQPARVPPLLFKD